MITLEQAKKVFCDMVEKADGCYEIFEVWEMDIGYPIYVMTVIDGDGNQRFPGDPFKSIKKENGELIDYSFPVPA